MFMQRFNTRRLLKALTGLTLSATFILGFLESCDDKMIGLSRFFDPCGTFLANCQPGELELRAAGPGDFDVDCTCTVPGQCLGQDINIGTISELCD